MWRKNPLCTPANEDLGTLAEYDPLTGYEPNDHHISETTEPHIQESTGENRSLNSHDLDYDDYAIGMALSSPLFTQEREDAANLRQIKHSHEESLLPSQSFPVCHSRTNWKDSWIHLSLVSDEEVVCLSHAKVYVFSDSVLCLGKMIRNPQSNIVWEEK